MKDDLIVKGWLVLDCVCFGIYLGVVVYELVL